LKEKEEAAKHRLEEEHRTQHQDPGEGSAQIKTAKGGVLLEESSIELSY